MSKIMQEFGDDLFAASEENAGICTECRAIVYGVEPDARKYECEYCEAKAVYGIEEAVLMFGC